MGNQIGKTKITVSSSSALLMLFACWMLIDENGVTSGIFSFIVILMAMGSVIILLFPFRYVSARQAILLFVLFAFLEQLIF